MRSTILLLFFSFFCFYSNAQPIDACPDPGTAELESTCGSACVLCELDGYTGDNDGNMLGEAPPGFCAAGLHNTQWIGFIAGSVNLTIEISVFNCTVVNEGLQIGIYNTTDCQNYTSVSNCDDEIPEGTTQAFTNTVPLVPGGIYFLVVDGFNGDICEFSVVVTSGSATAPTVDAIVPVITAPIEGCPGEAIDVSTLLVDGAGAYYWTLDGDEVGGDNETSIVLPSGEGTYELCVTPYNPCSDGIQNCVMIDVVEPDVNVWQDIVICEGDTYAYFGNDYTEEGQYFFTVDVPNECPQVIQLDLAVNPIDNTFLDITLCPGVGYSFNGNTYYDEGNYDAVLPGSDGCDSIATLNLMYEGTDFNTIFFEEMCDGEIYEIGGEFLTESGSYFFIFEDEYGCDSVVDMDLLVYPAEDILVEQTICDGDSYMFYGVNYSASGMYSTMTQTSNGCDIEAILDLDVSPAANTTINASICNGQSYMIGSNEYMTTGVFTNTFTASDGCDSVVVLNLEVVQVLLQTEEVTICPGDTVFVDSQAYFATGTYSNDYTSTAGCDSTYQLVLTVLDDVVMNINPSICAGTSFDIGSESFDATGLYEVVFDAANGCDSIVLVDLVVENQLMGNSALSLCNGESVTVQGQLLDATGAYDFPYTTAEGCDSLHQLNLTIQPPLTNTINPILCTGSTFQIGSESFDLAGSYVVTLTSVDGCDSLVTVNLGFSDAVYTPLDVSLCDGDTTYITNIPYTTTGNYEELLFAQNGCDSIVQLALLVIPNTAETLSPVICDGDTFEVEGMIFDATGYL